MEGCKKDGSRREKGTPESEEIGMPVCSEQGSDGNFCSCIPRARCKTLPGHSRPLTPWPVEEIRQAKRVQAVRIHSYSALPPFATPPRGPRTAAPAPLLPALWRTI